MLKNIMDDKKNNDTTFNLQTSLSPLWKSTYYSGLAFDWCCSMPKQNLLLKCTHFLMLCFSLVSQFYFILNSVFKLNRVIKNPDSKVINIVQDMMPLCDQMITLFACCYFIVYRTEIQTFFSQWGQMEEHNKNIVKGTEALKMKRVCTIVYAIYYIGSISFLLYAIYLNAADREPITIENDLMVNFYPGWILNRGFVIWVKFQRVFFFLVFLLFCPFVDMVPAMIYYHAAKIVEGMQREVRELATNGYKNLSSLSQPEIMYSLWSRFEALKMMVGRADDLFGPLIILCQGYLFFNLCGYIYFLLRSMTDSVLEPQSNIFEPLFLLFPLLWRLIVTISFMGKLHRSSSELLSALSYFSNQRANCSDKEERRMVSSCLSGLNQIKLAACPSGFYKIKPSIFLTLLSLIVTYTIILLQTSDGSSISLTRQNNKCPCI